MYKFHLLTVSIFSFSILFGQKSDSLPKVKATNFETVDILAYFNKLPLLGLTSSAQNISKELIETQGTTTLLPAINTVSGIRMEQRSPGSYRLAMRGSLIRSPFGIRNTKIYMDEFPLTDAGGNTYLNLIDPASLSSIHVIKGPDGSLYGANSGGVIRLQPKGFDVKENQASLLLNGGSFGLFQEQLSVQRKVNEQYSFSVDQSYTQSDGYRDQSALNKFTFQTAHKWKYSDKNELRVLALFSDLHYESPGGLTEFQFLEHPTMARPAAGPNPSAEEQDAGIYNETFYGGIAHDSKITKNLSHTISVFGSHTNFENPFITNYEFRKEQNLGLRTFFSYKDTVNTKIRWEMQLGFEGQKGWAAIDNFDNNGGVKGDAQAKDELDNTQGSYFYRAMTNLFDRWTIEGSIGLNHMKINYNSLYPIVANPEGTIDFGNILMPRVATSLLITKNFAFRGSISKGYSPPTIAEVRSSDQTINTELNPETGINYEIGLRWESSNRRFIADLGYYFYDMNNGIVRQLDEGGAEYFVNAGEMNQQGIEALVWTYLITPKDKGFIRELKFQTAFTYNHYRFGNYQVDENDYSNNKITAVPDNTWSNTLSFEFPHQIGINVSHYYMSAMPLNDANSVFSDEFNLVQLKATWKWELSKSLQLEFFAGIDNFLNEKYSLGNDINAYGDRYFNPAATRNYYGGVKVGF
ncbi:TonB-dependent receptor [Brumimicrobium aurantiacum]|uniref:TonB-dependent receptor n=1 Tax=Brumimicrobium aurantiacum TaxID=1737063 RepID=A0A3E1EYJ1_9FLAO|nr:TonB-dependent receptor [Brumimicrobium aurantiacum]RFC54614.1 TonB-dependent receptor [Brumimicrobium aurantiacum]